MGKISIIIPIYKVEKFLKKCIESVISQTYKDLEIILVDDGSPDKCPEICEVYAKKDKRIKVIHKENGGLSSARNAGLEIANGDFVYFLDSDDYIEENTFEKLMPYFGNTDVLIFGYLKEYDSNTIAYDFKNLEFKSNEEQLKVLMSDWSFGFVWNKIYRRKVLCKFNRVPREDLDFNARVFHNVNSFKVVPGVYHHYVQQSNSITHKVQEISFNSLVDCHRNMLAFLNDKQYVKLIPYQNTAFLKSLINVFKYDVYLKKINPRKKFSYNDLFESIYVQQALANYKTNNFREKIYIFLIKHKMISILKLFIKRG